MPAPSPMETPKERERRYLREFFSPMSEDWILEKVTVMLCIPAIVLVILKLINN